MRPTDIQRIRAIDSHIGEKPTRFVWEGLAEPGGNSMAEKQINFSKVLEWLRSVVVRQP